MDRARASERKAWSVPATARERIRTYNFPQGRVTDHRINLTLYKLDRIISGDDLGEIVDALVAQDQAEPSGRVRSGGRVSDSRLLEAARRLAAAGIEIARSRRTAAAGPCEWPIARWRFESLRLGSRRAAREPLAYITGRKEFWSLDFEVGPGVSDSTSRNRDARSNRRSPSSPIAPRRSRSSIWAQAPAVCCRLLKEFPNAAGLGIDKSEEAQVYVSRNVARHGLVGRCAIQSGDWAEVFAGLYDVILSNPPYITDRGLDRP